MTGMSLTPAEREVVLLSLEVAALSVALSLPPAVAIGRWLARTRSRLRDLVATGVLLPLVVPPVVTGYLLLLLVGRSGPVGRAVEALTGERIAFTKAAAVLAAAVVGFPLLVESIRLAILGVDPRLEAVGRTLGRGRAAVFARVTLPLALPGIAGGVVLAFARSLGEFGATIIVAGDVQGATRTIPIAVYTALNAPGGEHTAGKLVAISVGASVAALLAATALLARSRAADRGGGTEGGRRGGA